MASHLANIFGTEQDRVNCSFYLKIGACRHGDRCSRKHIKPQFSQTIMLPNVYNNPGHASEGARIGEERLQKNFDQFYEDWWVELAKFGNLVELHVCDNVGDHLMGNVYARYEWEAEATTAVRELNDRWYAMRPLLAELSPVSDFKEACCRQNELGTCTREGFCNFMHTLHPTPTLLSSLKASQRVSRRLAAERGDSLNKAGDEMGWTPSAARKKVDNGGGGREREREREREGGRHGHGYGGGDGYDRREGDVYVPGQRRDRERDYR